MNDEAPVALVGYGSAGQEFHAQLLRAAGAAPGLVVTGNPGRSARAARDLPGARIVPDLDAALRAGPRLVVLASPSGVHADQALACIEAGVPVVVDKPLGVDADQAARIVAAAARTRVALTVFQNRRWDPENLTLRRLVRQGTLGEVHRFERRWERWRPVPKDRWRENLPSADGGGILLDLQTHLVDSAVHLFGPVVSVHAEIASRTTVAEDESFLSLRHAGGVRSHLAAATLAGAPGPRTRVLCGGGAYVVTEFFGEQAAFGGFEDSPGHCGWIVAGTERTPVPVEPGDPVDFYRTVLRALALPSGDVRQAAMPVNPLDAVHVLRVLDAARVSASTDTTVPVDQTFP
ncbi:MAG: Gfo/Idh/MocA family oxidoreductase [Actinomycetota bacterium]|nr:Gfo/Idh/MocA family oxidoreductase [Actinomycetota bacterium]